MEALSKLTLVEPGDGPGVGFVAQDGLLDCLRDGLEALVPGAHGHARRVSRYSAGIARQLDLPWREVAQVRQAAAVHDIGKLEMPAWIVNKRGPLSDEEFAIVEKHVLIGAKMVAGLGEDEEMVSIVRHHHERFDGRGYPDGLAGEEIPLGARIVAVADTFDAVTASRPYRAAVGHPEAFELLGAVAGTQLDPELVRAFLGCYEGSAVLLRVAFGE
jgi:putative nucleotidyltransferase with HDIG domain